MQTNSQTKAKRAVNHAAAKLAKKPAATRKSKADAKAAVAAFMESGDIQFASVMSPAASAASAEPTDAPRQDRNILVPLSLLVASPRNVRRMSAGNVEELAALIESQGLLHSLIVAHLVVDEVPTDKMEVIAGGRRLAALQLLAERGTIGTDELIECKLIDADKATEVSLAENSGRIAMHPADQFDAFLKLHNQGKSVEEIAVRFGVSPLTVNRRLRLTTVAPSLIEKFRADELTLDQMMALAVTDDHAAQETLWEAASSSYWMKEPDHLRRALKQQEISASDHPMVRLIGIETYLAAGGHVRRDLFSEREDDGFITDTVLLNRLAAEKLNVLAESYRQAGWQWVEVRETFGWQERQAFDSLEDAAVSREPNAAEACALEEAEREREDAENTLDEIDRLGGGGGTDEEDDIYSDTIDRHKKATVLLEQLRQQLIDFPDDVKAQSGVVLTVEPDGSVEAVMALVRNEDRSDEPGQGDQIDSATGVPRIGSVSTATAKQKPEIAEKLMQKLSSHRTAAMQVLLADNHLVALAVVADAMLHNIKKGYASGPMELRVDSSRHALTTHAADIKTSRAWREMDAKLEALSDQLAELDGSTFEWLLTQTIDELVGIIALCSAVGLNAVTTDCKSQPATELAAALHLDMADWWQPTAASYFADISKEKILSVVAQACGVEKVRTLDKMKKGDLVTAAEQAMRDTRWLPVPLR